MLKKIMNLDYVKSGINSNLVEDKCASERMIEYIKKSLKDNTICLDVTECGVEGVVEASLYKGEETGQYLLDVRLFDKEDAMVNAYLEIINKDLSNHGECVDDVWSYDNWEVV